MIGNIKRELDQDLLEEFVRVSEATRILGFASHNSVEYYIRIGKLKPLMCCGMRVLYRNDVMSLKSVEVLDSM